MNILLRSFLIIILLTNYSISSDIELKNPKTIGNTTIQTNRFGGSATIISEDEIKTSGAQSVGDLLKLVPGLSVKQTGGRGGLISVFSRGSESDHNLVIIDGVKYNDVGGSFNFEFVSINNIESIEVLRGPMAGFFGSSALGSVIIINTKKPSNKTQISVMSSFGINQSFKKDTTGQTDGGTFLSNEQAVSISGPFNKQSNDILIGYVLSYDRVDDDGFRIFNDAYNNKALNAGINLSALNEKLQIKTLISDRWATVRYPTSSSGSVGAFNSTSGTQRDWRHLNSRSINTSYELYENNLIGFDFSYFFNKRATRDAGSGNVDWWEKKKNYNYYYQVKNFTFSTISVDAKIGYEYLDETSNYHKNASSYATDYGHKTYIDSIYGMLALNFQENFFADIAFRKDDHEYHGTTYSPTVFLSKYISETIKIRSGFSEGIKYPSIYETYSVTGLKPEKNQSYEIGIDFENIKYALSLTAFKSKTNDMIAYRGGNPAYGNLDEAKSQGIEASGLVKLENQLSIKYWFTYLETKAVNVNNVVQQNSYNFANWQDDEALLRRPKTSGGLIVSKKHNDLFVALDTSYTGGRWDYENSSTRIYNDSFWDFGLYGDYLLEKDDLYASKIFIQVSNLFNDKREEILNFTSPGRTIMIGYRYDTSK